jgi:hypothetical protein
MRLINDIFTKLLVTLLKHYHKVNLNNCNYIISYWFMYKKFKEINKGKLIVLT